MSVSGSPSWPEIWWADIPGIFVGIGTALAGAGPAGLLMAFVITGAVVWTVMQSIGEMATLVSPAPDFGREYSVTDVSFPWKVTSPTTAHASSNLR